MIAEETAIERLHEAAAHGPLRLAHSGGKDSLVVALLLQRSGLAFDGVCETSFYFAEQERDIRATAARLGLPIKWSRRLDVEWIRRRPALVFSDSPAMRSWTFSQRHQRTVALACRGDNAVAVFGRRRQENTVPGYLYETRAGWQAHPIFDWTEFQVWDYIRERGVERPWIYGTPFGPLAGNAPFYTLRARDAGGVDAAWALCSALDSTINREAILGR